MVALGLSVALWSVSAPGKLQAILRDDGNEWELRSTDERFRDPVACKITDVSELLKDNADEFSWTKAVQLKAICMAGIVQHSCLSP